MRSLTQSSANLSSKILLLEEMEKFVSQDTGVLSGKAFFCTVICELTWVFIPDTIEKQMFYLACQICKKKVNE